MPEFTSLTSPELPPQFEHEQPFFPVFRERGELTPEQYEVLMRELRPSRVATRSQGGRDLSYLEAWDVRAHLIRIFGFGSFDAHVVDVQHCFTREIEVGQNKNPGIEVAYLVTFHLAIRDADGRPLCAFTESAVGSASGSVGYGDLHDNAVKQGASDALKRCAINLGTQFGLSLYDNGAKTDVVKTTLVRPKGVEADTPSEAAGGDLRPDQRETLERSLGATEISETPDSASQSETPADGPQFETKVDTPAQAKAAVDSMTQQAKARGVPAANDA